MKGVPRQRLSASAPALVPALVVATILGAAGWAGWGLWRADRELDRSQVRVEQAARLAVERRRWQPPPARFEAVAGRPQFVDAAIFADSLWLAARGGVFRYSPQGDLLRAWRVGIDLPPSPPNAVATGLDPATRRPALFVATAGAGLLAFSADEQVDQILPAEAGLRNLTALLPRASGEIVLGSLHAGVASYSAGGLRRLDEELDAVQVTALAGDEGDLWVGTISEGLLRWTGGRLARWGSAELLPDQRVLSLAGSGERLFIGTPAGVAEMESGKVSRTLADGFFAQALLDEGRELLIGSLDEGLVAVPLGAGSRARGDAGPDGVLRLLSSGDSQLAMTPDAVYTRTPGGRWELLVSPQDGLSARNISALHADENGRLWVGYFDRGLDVGQLDSVFEHHESDRIFCVNRIVADPERDRIAVATANGLLFFDPSGSPREVLTRADGLIADHISDVAVRADGLVLATAAGVTYWDKGGARSLYALHGLVNNHVYAVAAGGPALLAGTLGGLSVLEGGAVRDSYTTANSSLRHNWINAIEQLDGAWYVGTYGAGVHRFDGAGGWTSFPDMAGVEINPGAMAVGGELGGARRLYAGTLDRGLLVYDSQQQRWSTVIEGLPSANVTALAAQAGTLWIGTDNGLVKIAEETLLWP